jgi:sugar lactone lactonase YvrE
LILKLVQLAVGSGEAISSREAISNLCFGGPKRNRLFITASQSLYAVYVETKGAHIA